MTASQLRKRIARALMVSWREQPTRYDIEALQANIRRVGLVIRVRWMLIGMLVTYSAIAGSLYMRRIEPVELMRLMWIPAVALLGVVGYNTFYSLNYKRLGNIAYWNNLQLALDALVVTILVSFSGGVNSWFWSMYSLFILEAAFILPRSRDAWVLALGCVVLLGGVEISELFGLLPHANIPFATSNLHADPIFVSVRYLWQVAVLIGTASVSTMLVGAFRREIASRRAQALVDETTGLYTRAYFLRACSAEMRRAQRDGRPVHVMLFDIDHFGEFNSRFGIDAGDRLLAALASGLSDALALAGDPATSSNLVARFGGEEFVLLLAEDVRVQGDPSASDALRLAERAREVVQSVRVDGAGVTVSVGVATMPTDGHTVDELLDAADGALVHAIERGGNRVVSAAEITPSDEDADSGEDVRDRTYGD